MHIKSGITEKSKPNFTVSVERSMRNDLSVEELIIKIIYPCKYSDKIKEF